MGIPHLITHLRPYATTCTLTKNRVIIDGPALAYHVYHICVASRKGARNPFEAVPSYGLIGQTVKKWLDLLISQGVILEKIYFDGFLPRSKRSTRLSRLMNYTTQLSVYYEAWPQIIPTSILQSTGTEVDIFGDNAVPSNFSRIPAASFLVPAVIEALRMSAEYCHLVEVVPGEADASCAKYLKKNGGTVLTGDSDLLVHDLGDSGTVGFFKDLDFVSLEGVVTVTYVQYNPTEAAVRLGLPAHSIPALAFEMTMDPHATFPQLLQRTMKLEAVREHKSTYDDFIAEYQSSSFSEFDLRNDGLSSDSPIKLRNRLQLLDPRISEYVLGFRKIEKKAQYEELSRWCASTGEHEREIFLPFLLDCPAKTSAWEMSTAVRQLAYGLLNLALDEEDRAVAVIERRRQQNGGGGRAWEVPNLAQLQEACEVMSSLISNIRLSNPNLSSVALWRVLSLHQEHVWAESLGKKPLGQITAAVKRGKGSSNYTWDVIHFTAQMHGSYYSFRILHQVLEIVRTVIALEAFPHFLEVLWANLDTFPGVLRLMALDDCMQWLESEEFGLETTIVQNQVSEEAGLEPQVARTGNDKQRKRKRKTAQDGDITIKKKTNNPFDILSTG